MTKKEYILAARLVDGCKAALSALQDHTRSERRIKENTDYLETVIKEWKAYVISQAT